MNYIDWIGSLGVFLILVAYFLQTFRVLSNSGIPYVALNLIGALLACMASILLKYIPFIILEGAWAIISLFSLLKILKSRST